MTIYLTVDYNTDEGRTLYTIFDKNPFSRVNRVEDICYITTNYRVLVENDLTSLVDKMVAPTEYHEKRYTFRVECSEAIAREWNRHRGSPGNSISQRSTRYCNYNKDKYGKELTMIVPEWIYQYADSDIPADPKEMMEGLRRCNDTVFYYMNALEYSEHLYMKMIENGRKPQEARGILPLDLKTEVYYTMYDNDWQHFIELRTVANAHPDIQVLAKQIASKLEELR